MSISTVRYTLIFTINGTTYNKVVRPADGGFALSMTEDDYKKRVKNDGKFTFYNNLSDGIADFDILKTIEQNDALQRVYLKVEKMIDGVWIEKIQLRFSAADCDWDNDKCTCKVQPEAEDVYTCIYDDIETEYNILQEVPVAPPVIIVNPVDIDLFSCKKNYIIPANTTAGCAQPLNLNWQGGLDFSDAGLTGSAQGMPYDFGTINNSPSDTYDTHPYYDVKTILAGSCFNTSLFPYGGGWQPVSAIYAKYRVISSKIRITGVANALAGLFYAEVETVWGAETVITLNDPVTNAYDPPAGLGWIPFKDIFQGGQQAVIWGREPFYNDQTYIYNHDVSDCNYHEYNLINPYVNNSALRADIYRGRLLNDAIQMFLNKSGCGLTLKSEFLQSNINPVTGENNPVYTLNEITDIKTPTSTEAASWMLLSFDELLNNLENMMQLYWYRSGDYFIIEHDRYFKNGYSYQPINQTSVDIRTRTSQSGNREIVKTNNYRYDKASIYKSESIDPAQYLDYDFSKLTIKYDVGLIKDENNLGHSITFVTDVAGVASNPSAFSNDGVVMLAYRNQLVNPVSNQYANVVINEYGYRTLNGVNGREVTNGWLSISNLFNRFYRDNRIKLTGTIENDIQETFLSETDKIIQSVSLRDCDMGLFLNDSLITTDLGTGRITDAKHLVAQNRTELTILL